jgi:hypothetical protein
MEQLIEEHGQELGEHDLQQLLQTVEEEEALMQQRAGSPMEIDEVRQR